MISSYDQPSKTEQIARSRTRRRRAARPMRICVPGGIWVYDFILKQSFAVHQLRVKDGRAGRTTDGVVAQDPELVVENGTRADGADDNRHPLSAVAIKSRLRPLNVGFERHHRPRCRW